MDQPSSLTSCIDSTESSSSGKPATLRVRSASEINIDVKRKIVLSTKKGKTTLNEKHASDDNGDGNNRWISPVLKPSFGVVQPRVVPPAGKPTRRTNQLQYLQKEVLPAVLKHENSGPFVKPVDAVFLDVEDYHKIIKKPMDLGTIAKRLKNRYYYTAQECIQDFTTLFENCYTYNREGSEIVLIAKELENVFLEKMESMPAEELDLDRRKKKTVKKTKKETTIPVTNEPVQKSPDSLEPEVSSKSTIPCPVKKDLKPCLRAARRLSQNAIRRLSVGRRSSIMDNERTLPRIRVLPDHWRESLARPTKIRFRESGINVMEISALSDKPWGHVRMPVSPPQEEPDATTKSDRGTGGRRGKKKKTTTRKRRKMGKAAPAEFAGGVREKDPAMATDLTIQPVVLQSNQVQATGNGGSVAQPKEEKLTKSTKTPKTSKKLEKSMKTPTDAVEHAVDAVQLEENIKSPYSKCQHAPAKRTQLARSTDSITDQTPSQCNPGRITRSMAAKLAKQQQAPNPPSPIPTSTIVTKGRSKKNMGID